MKVTNVHSPHAVAPTQASANSAQDSRARAIAKLTAQPVQNQNQVSPEEIAVVVPQEGQAIDKTADIEATLAAEETPVAKTPEQELLSKQFAVLARKEKALRAKQQQLEAEHKAKLAELANKEKEFQSKPSFDESQYISKARFKSNPLDVMAETGLSYDEIVQQLMNTTPVDPRVNATISKLEAKILELEKQNENAKLEQAQSQTAQYEAAKRQIRTDVQKLVKADPIFETIKATNSVEDVVELIEKTWKEDGIMMTTEEACNEVEEYLMDEALKLTRIEKIKKKLEAGRTPEQKPQTQPQTSQSQQQPQQMKTLTNNAASTRKLSSRERALLAFKGELK